MHIAINHELARGVGARASHLVNGHDAEHEALERELAEFTGRERALLFSTGYMANLGVVGAFADAEEVVQDALADVADVEMALADGACLLSKTLDEIEGYGMTPVAVAAEYWKVSEGFAGLTNVIGEPLPVTYSPFMYALCIVMI